MPCPPMKILVAVDGSPCSLAAIAEVATRPWPDGSRVKVVLVDAPRKDEYAMRRSPSAFDEINRTLRAEATEDLEKAVDALRTTAPHLPVESVLREGWPKDEILDVAEAWCADLIVVGSHGRGAFKRIFLGSVSLAVATHATCSVEIVRSQHSLAALPHS